MVWPGIAAALLVLAPLALALTRGEWNEDGRAAAVVTTAVLVDLLALSGALLFLAAWRLNPTERSRRLAAVMAFLGLHDLPFSLAVIHEDTHRTGLAWSITAMVVAAGGVAALLVPTRTARLSPMVPAVALAMIAVGLRSTLADVGVGDRVDLAAGAMVPTLLFGAVVAFLVNLGAARLATQLAAHEGEVDRLRHRATAAEADVQHRRELLHELNSTVAGIAAAEQVLAGPEGAHHQNRAQLEEMLSSELARLRRMLAEQGPEPTCPIQLDEVLRPLVVAQWVRGHHVWWEPTGHVVYGRSDTIAAIVHNVLVNASVHGGSFASVQVRGGDGVVEIRVTDSGPGVPAGLEQRLFDWGVHGPSSPGQGIGLGVAHRLSHELGGHLSVESGEPGAGATFVLTLAAPRSEDVIAPSATEQLRIGAGA